MPSSISTSRSELATSLDTSERSWSSTAATWALRRNTMVPMPAANSPTVRTATVTPVTFARRLMPRHHRVTRSDFFELRGMPLYALLPALSM